MDEGLIYALVIVGFSAMLSCSYMNKLENEKADALKLLQSENCKFTEFIAASSIFENDRYKYVCAKKTYISDVDFSGELNK